MSWSELADAGAGRSAASATSISCSRTTPTRRAPGPRRGRRARHYDAQWNDDFHHVAHVLLTGERAGYYADYADRPVGAGSAAL